MRRCGVEVEGGWLERGSVGICRQFEGKRKTVDAGGEIPASRESGADGTEASNPCRVTSQCT